MVFTQWCNSRSVELTMMSSCLLFRSSSNWWIRTSWWATVLLLLSDSSCRCLSASSSSLFTLVNSRRVAFLSLVASWSITTLVVIGVKTEEGGSVLLALTSTSSHRFLMEKIAIFASEFYFSASKISEIFRTPPFF